MYSVCRCSLPVWRRSSLKKGNPVTYFCPDLDPPLGGVGRKTTTLVRDHEYFIPTKFHQNPLSCSGEEVENVKNYERPRRTDDGRTDGRRAMTKAHLSLRLRWTNDWLMTRGELLNNIPRLVIFYFYFTEDLLHSVYLFSENWKVSLNAILQLCWCIG